MDGVLVGEVGNKCYVECSNRGTCNHKTGVCTCYLGSVGASCNKLAGGIVVFILNIYMYMPHVMYYL